MLNITTIKKIFPWLIAILICVTVATFIRLYPLRVSLSSEAHEKASMLVVYRIQQGFFQQIMQQNPSTPVGVAQQMALAQLNKLMHEHPESVMAAIDRGSQEIAKSSPEKEENYLLESDPFYYLNLSDNILNKGQLAPTINGSKYINPLMNAPEGSSQPFTIHPYFAVYLYNFLHIFDPTIDLMTAAAFVPVIISAFTILIFFLVCYFLSLTLWATTLAAFTLTLAPIYLKRSAFGWFDTDPYNVLFTIALLALLLFGLRDYQKNKAIIYGIGFSIAMTIFALIWQGWVMMFIVNAGCVLSLIFYSIVSKRHHDYIKPSLIFLATSICCAFLGIGLCFGFGDFFALFSEGFGELSKFTVKGMDVWPNLFIGVGELKRSTFGDFIKSFGGILIVISMIISSSFAMIHYLRKFNSSKSAELLLISTLLGATIILSIGAERFILFSLIPLSLLIAYGIDLIKGPRWIKPTLTIVCALLISIQANSTIPTTVTPIFNPVWDKTLTDIKLRTPANAIVNTWWPPGHFIKAIAKRAVIFDGATLSEGAIGYWFSRALLSTDENKAQGILRMINISRNQSVELLHKQGLSIAQSASIVEQLATMNKGQIQQSLSGKLPLPIINQLILLLRGSTPNSYLLLYNELIDENIILSFTGNWNIGKIEAINANPTLLTKVPKRGSQDFIDFCWSIAGGQPKVSPPLNLINEDSTTYYFEQGLRVSKNSWFANINSPTYGNGQPLSVINQIDQQIIETPNASANLNYSVVLYQENNQTLARLMDQNIANSVMVKLYFFNGIGLKHFKAFNTFTDLSRRTTMKTFEINWKE